MLLELKVREKQTVASIKKRKCRDRCKRYLLPWKLKINNISYKNSPFTTSCTRVCACPKMFLAEHWYSPESFALKFFKINLPPETADLLTSERLPPLLQTNAGSGLPLTEHWNEAVPLSFTVRFEAETATAGAENWFTRLSFRSRHTSGSCISFLAFKS